MTEKPVVLITGASQGIGREFVKIMARANYHIIATARSQNALEVLDDEVLAEVGENITIAPLDLKDGAGIDRLGYSIFTRFGKLDGLIHCGAKLNDLSPVAHVTPRDAQSIIDINLIASFRLIASMTMLLEAAPNGRAVFLTSSLAKDPRANWGLYAASKAGLNALVQSWAKEQSLNNIVATLLNPSAIATPMRKRAFPGEDQTTLPPPSAMGSLLLELMSPLRDKNLNGALVNFRDSEHFKAWQEISKPSPNPN